MDLEKIVVIGPVYPFKGGISHYTGLLYKSLSKKYNTAMVSYKMQYPKLLFKKEQRDYSNDRFKIDETKFWINTANPFNIIATAVKINKLNPDLVIIQWWHPYFSPCYWLLTHLLPKAKIMYICHNVFPHERFILDRQLTKMALKSGDMFITQSQKDGQDLLTIKKNAVFDVAVHPTYNAFKIHNLQKEQAREILNLSNSDKVLLFFGFVRPYKGLQYILKAMPLINKVFDDCKLLIVGDFGENKKEYEPLIHDCKESVQIYEGYIPDQDVEKYFAACDLVVLPYESATQSGIAQIAFGFNRPIVATNVGGLPEVIEDGKTGFIVQPKDEGELAKAVIRFFAENCSEAFVDNIKRNEDRFSWERLVEKIETLYRSFGKEN